jgi:hypothetical protein
MNKYNPFVCVCVCVCVTKTLDWILFTEENHFEL